MNTAKQVENRLKQLSKHGQSIWLDFIQRSYLKKGELRKLVDEDGLRGVTSNPSIFEKAIAHSDDYKDELAELVADKSLDANAIYEKLAIADIRDACDALKTVYSETAGRDGYVSMEVSPLLANNTQATIEEARRLWKEIDRPNLMIKVPGTEEGAPAIQTLISEGINVNVTLLFSCEAYSRVAEAYISGLEALAEKGKDLSEVASVASFFVSRIDSLVDSLLKKIKEKAETEKEQERADNLMGKAAIANAKLAYQIYRKLYTSERWRELVSKGARPQRLLWASTSTKDPRYPDTMYVDELIGNETVNTLPLETLDAFRDHGTLEDTLEKRLDEPDNVMDSLSRIGIDFKQVTDQLLEEGVDKFAVSFRQLLDAVRKQRRELVPPVVDEMQYKVSEELETKIKATIKEWKEKKNVYKLWYKDTSLWTGSDEDKWLDWLDIVETQSRNVYVFDELNQLSRDSGYKHVLLLGMGGSSLCPEVLSVTFGKEDNYPELSILDSTDPEQILAKHKSIDMKETLFIVSSKSGSTLEPNIYTAYFLDELKKVVGDDQATKQWIAITDPGSKLEEFAQAEHFQAIYHGVPGIGGRYSALSNFGLVPAAVMGLDLHKLLDHTKEMVDACEIDDKIEKNPGVLLGIILGVCQTNGKDKLTIITSDGISDLGAWLEQLVAESTGKDGKAIIPVDRELLGATGAYGDDRVFVYLSVEGEPDEVRESAIDSLEAAGHPVIRIKLMDKYHIGQEFFRWEIATAVAGSIMKINPFNQPDVEASKVATRALTKAYETAGTLPPETPLYEDEKFKLFADNDNSNDLIEAVGEERTLDSYLKAHLSRIKKDDYFAVLAYIHMNEENERLLQNIRHAARDSKKVATCLGFGPRFLHSTGQAYKGGPNSGVFLQVTADHKEDLQVPDHKYTFGVVIDAQARGDLEVLSERGRRALRIHILDDVNEGLKTIQKAFADALAE